MTSLEWKAHPSAPLPDNMQFQVAQTPKFKIWRFYEIGPGQRHYLEKVTGRDFEDKQGFCPHTDIILVTKGKWRFEAANLPDQSHAFTVNDGAFKVRSSMQYTIVSEDETGSGYVCISPRTDDWYERELVLIPAGESVTLPARGTDTYLYIGRGDADVNGERADPNEIMHVPADADMQIDAISKVTAVTFWPGAMPKKLTDLA